MTSKRRIPDSKIQLNNSTFEVLFAVEEGPHTNDCMVRSLRRLPSSISRDTSILIKHELVERCEDDKKPVFCVTDEGKKFIDMSIAFDDYLSDFREFVQKLMKKPVNKGGCFGC